MVSILWNLLTIKFVRYLVVGGSAFIMEFLSFIALYQHIKLILVLSNAISFCIGLLTSFVLNRLWTFAAKHKFKHTTSKQLNMYVSLALINLIATLMIVQILKSVGLEANTSKLIAMCLTSIWNFAIFKIYIFKHSVDL